MAVKARGKIVRRLGVNVFANPKYDRLLSKKPQGPGKERGFRSRSKTSVYGEQLKEKQKFRFAYGVSEKQLTNIYKAAKAMKGVTGTNMLVLLEERLDNVVYRMGFASSRAQARQLVNHGHFLLNGKRADVASIKVRPNDLIEVKDRKGVKVLVRENLTKAVSTQFRPWMSVDSDNLKGTILAVPQEVDVVTPDANIQLVVEWYARR